MTAVGRIEPFKKLLFGSILRPLLVKGVDQLRSNLTLVVRSDTSYYTELALLQNKWSQFTYFLSPGIIYALLTFPPDIKSSLKYHNNLLAALGDRKHSV